ncbi:MAG TPA: hydrogenase 3 maturation endopeptidase HyCI [Lentisphaeria bacterium]|nr:MAG: hypothetical protein A2X48_20150 [Lentisphaerae bacterium GWF2_49_21]HBC86219.1 hydrogenase 3 maturation endopeptidase HyCI [Lentisphaeria bacterium]
MPISKLKKLLKARLEQAERVAIVGVGSELRADDIAGTLAVDHLGKLLRKKKTYCGFRLLQGCTAPENITGEIRKYNPTHLIMIDAADLEAKPGTISLIKPEELSGASFSTHMMPLEVMINYVLQSVKCEIIMIGIQPKVLEFGKKSSKEVQSASLQLAEDIAEILTARSAK